MVIEYKWVPKQRTKFVADDGREFDLPAAWEWFFDELPEDERMEVLQKTGIINRRQCRALWRWLGRTDRAPKSLRAYLCRADFEPWLEELKASKARGA